MVKTGLCVGGPYDRKRVPCNRQWFTVPEIGPLTSLRGVNFDNPVSPVEVTYHQYRCEIFHTPEKDFAIFVPSKQTIAETMEKLLTDYMEKVGDKNG